MYLLSLRADGCFAYCAWPVSRKFPRCRHPLVSVGLGRRTTRAFLRSRRLKPTHNTRSIFSQYSIGRQFAFNMWSICSQCSVNIQSAFNLHSICGQLQSMFSQYAVALRSICSQCVVDSVPSDVRVGQQETVKHTVNKEKINCQ